MVLVDERRATGTVPVRPGASPRPAGSSTRRRSRAAIAPGAIGLAATLYVGIGSWIPSVWYDEAATITSATRTWGQLWAELAHVDIVHGLYYAGMHLWFDLVGYSPFTLRAPSAVAIGLTSALLVVVLRSAMSARVGVLAGIVLPLIPRVAWAGGEGRSYAFTILAAVAVSTVLWLALRTGRKRWWLAYGIIATLSVLLFLYLALLLLAHLVTLLVLVVVGRLERRDLLAWSTTAAAVGAACAPLVLLARQQDAQLDWIPPLGHRTPRFVLVGQWFDGSIPAAVGFGALVIAGIAVLVRRRSLLAAWLIPALVLPSSALLIATATITPLYSPKYVTFVTPALAVAIAAALAAVRVRPVRVVALAAIAALSLTMLVTDLRIPEAKQKSTWSDVAQLVAEERGADPVRTAILWGPVRYHLSATSRVISYAYPDAFAGTIDPTLVTPAAESGRLWERRGMLADSLGAFEGARAAYLVTSVKRDWIPSYTATLDGIGWHPVERWRVGDVNVVKFAPDA